MIVFDSCVVYPHQGEGQNSVNIGGKLRKQILAEVDKCGSDEELSMLLPGVLEKAVEEVMRVLEYDL